MWLFQNVCVQIPEQLHLEISEYQKGLQTWHTINQNLPTAVGIQKYWNTINVDRLVTTSQFDSDEEKARFLANQRTEFDAWFHSLPSKEVRALSNNNAFRIYIVYIWDVISADSMSFHLSVISILLFCLTFLLGCQNLYEKILCFRFNRQLAYFKVIPLKVK